MRGWPFTYGFWSLCFIKLVDLACQLVMSSSLLNETLIFYANEIILVLMSVCHTVIFSVSRNGLESKPIIRYVRYNSNKKHTIWILCFFFSRHLHVAKNCAKTTKIANKSTSSLYSWTNYYLFKLLHAISHFYLFTVSFSVSCDNDEFEREISILNLELLVFVMRYLICSLSMNHC